jgi:hypothetical protein
LLDLELAAVEHQPDPPAPELRERDLRKLEARIRETLKLIGKANACFRGSALPELALRRSAERLQSLPRHPCQFA